MITACIFSPPDLPAQITDMAVPISSCLLLTLAAFCFALPNARITLEVDPLGSGQHLSYELAAILAEDFHGVPSAPTDIPQHVVRWSTEIDYLAALDDDSPVSKRAAAACRIAYLIFPGRVSSASDPSYQDEQEFNWSATGRHTGVSRASANGYRSQTCWLPAACFIRLQTAADVAAALKVISHVGSKFAVRSGGHNPNAGFGSIDGSGVLLDLQDVDDLVLGEHGILHAGPGNTWGEVYDFLDPHGITAIGGRHYTVGLPGFLLGGTYDFRPFPSPFP